MVTWVTDKQYESIFEKLSKIGQQVRQPNGYLFDPLSLEEFLQRGIEGKFNGMNGMTVEKVEKKVTLVRVSSTMLDPEPAKMTVKCLRGNCWAPRELHLDARLADEQPATGATSMSTYEFATDPTFPEMGQAALKLGSDFPIGGLKSCLLRHALTLPQIGQLIEKRESGIVTGLRADGYDNLAFIEDNKGGVCVIGVYQVGRRWDRHLYPFDSSHRLDRKCRLLLGESDASFL